MTFAQAMLLLFNITIVVLLFVALWVGIKYVADNFDNDGPNGGGKK